MASVGAESWCTDRQDRAAGLANHRLTNTAHQYMSESGAAMRSENEQVRIRFIGVTWDLGHRIFGRDVPLAK